MFAHFFVGAALLAPPPFVLVPRPAVAPPLVVVPPLIAAPPPRHFFTRVSELRLAGSRAKKNEALWRARARRVLGAMMPGEARQTCLALGGVQTVEARVDALVEGSVVSLRRSSRAKRSKLTSLRNRGLASHVAAQTSAIAAFVTDSEDGGATGGPVDFISSVSVF